MVYISYLTLTLVPHYLGKCKRLPYITIIIINTGKTLVGLIAFVCIRRKRATKQRKLELVAPWRLLTALQDLWCGARSTVSPPSLPAFGLRRSFAIT